MEHQTNKWYKQVMGGTVLLFALVLIAVGVNYYKQYQKEKRQYTRALEKKIHHSYRHYITEYFGEAEHWLSYDNRAIGEQEIKALAIYLEHHGFFDEEQKGVYVYKDIDNKFTFKIIDQKALNLEEEVVEKYKKLKQALLTYLEISEIEIILVKDEYLEEYARF